MIGFSFSRVHSGRLPEFGINQFHSIRSPASEAGISCGRHASMPFRNTGRTEEQRSYQVSNELYFSELRFRGEQKCYQRATAHLVIAFFPAPDTIGLVIQSSSYSGCGCTLEFSFNGTTVRRFVARWCTVHIVTRPLLLYCTVPHNKCLRRLNASRMSFFVHRYYVFIVVYCYRRYVKTKPARWVNYTTAVKPWLRSPLLESLINIDSWG